MSRKAWKCPQPCSDVDGFRVSHSSVFRFSPVLKGNDVSHTSPPACFQKVDWMTFWKYIQWLCTKVLRKCKLSFLNFFSTYILFRHTLPGTNNGFTKWRTPSMGILRHPAPLSWNQKTVVQFSRSVVSDSLWPYESQHARPPCHHKLPEFTQIHVHRVGDAIQPSHPLPSPSPPAPNPSQHQGLFKWVNS